MAQLSALPPPPLRPVSPLWTFRGLKRPQHVSAVQGRDVPATKLFAASVKNFCVCPRTTAPCRGSRCPIGKVHCGEKPRRSGRQKGLSPLRGSNRSARRPDSAEGDVFMTVSSTISVFCRDGVFHTCTVSRPGTVASCIPTMPPVSRPKPWLNTVISVASVPVATNPPGIRFRTRWTV